MTASGTHVGKYRLERELGAGGMGTVWLAHDTELDRKVALKVLRPALAGDDTAQARLLREARAMAKLRHPNVITVFDAETINGRDLVAMELIEGSNMAAWLASEHAQDEVIAAVLAAGRGLAAAHAAGMVHRDFKPHNVLVERAGRVLVTDFGLARAEVVNIDPLAVTAMPEAMSDPLPLALEETAASEPRKPVEMTATLPPSSKGSLDSDLTRTGTLLGTPAYMAPEQLRGAPADARADQFAFCVTAWEALAGKRPFPGDDVAAIAKAIEAGTPSFADRLPRRMRPLLQRGLAKDPAARWPSMEPLLDALDGAWKRPKKIRDWSMAIGMGMAVFIAIFVVMNLVGHDDKAAAGDVCKGSTALASEWNPAARDKLAKQLGKDGAHALAALDRWADTWTKAYDANCAKPADPDYSIRKICFESQRDSIDLLAHPPDADAAVALANADLAIMLPSPEACQLAPRVISPPLPKDPAVRRKVQKLHSLLLALRTKIFDRDSNSEALLEKANAAIKEAEGTGDSTVRAEALGLRALVLAFGRREKDTDRNASLAEAYQALREAGEAAEAAGNDRVRVQLLIGQLEMASGIPGYWADIDDLMRRAELGVEHVKDPQAQLMFDELKPEIALSRGAWTAAIDGFERARQGWLARGSGEMYAQFTAAEAQAMMNRHAGDDLDRAAAMLTEAEGHDLRPASHKLLTFVRALIDGTAGHATAAQARMFGAVATTGKDAPGSLTITLAGLGTPTLVDDAAARVSRRAAPDVFVTHGKDEWHVIPAAFDRFALSGLAPGNYDVRVLVSSALGDLETIRRRVQVTGVTAVTLDLPPAHEIDRRFGPTTGEALWGIAVALPGKVHPTTVAALKPLLDQAAWSSAAWVHTVRDGATVLLAAELGALGDPVTVCTVNGGTVSLSSLNITFGGDDHPVQCE
jgi:predicted Ser/Thr protein kinase